MSVLRLAVLVAVVTGFALVATAPARAATASCYGPGLYGNSTADGTTLTTSTIGIAHKSLPLGTKLWLRTNGVTIKIVVLDRGPYVAGRSIDVTEGAARRLGFDNCTSWGVRRVTSWRRK